jgi:hypothetical protein
MPKVVASRFPESAMIFLFYLFLMLLLAAILLNLAWTEHGLVKAISFVMAFLLFIFVLVTLSRWLDSMAH